MTATYEILSTGESFTTSTSTTLLDLVGQGGGSEIFRLKGSDGVVLKRYRPGVVIDWSRIEYQIQHPVERHQINSKQQRGYSWPLRIVEFEGKNIGITLPYFASKDWISLDNWIETHLVRNLGPEDISLSRRILILRNLANRIAFLHAAKVAVIDLKPSNVLVHRLTGEVSLIDCDSFRITSKADVIFPGTHVSAGYISPEAFRSGIDISSLSEAQDRYAFAVIAFQVLNYGIHPFQGILSAKLSDAETNDQKAALGLYPYAEFMKSGDSTMAPIIRPLPQSIHPTWPHELRHLFDKAFIGAARPTLRVWHRYFTEILTQKLLSPCSEYPTNVMHIRFADRACGTCAREAAILQIKDREPVARRSRQTPGPIAQILGGPAPGLPGISPDPQIGRILPIVAFALIGLLVWLVWISSQSQTNSTTRYPQPQTAPYSNSATIVPPATVNAPTYQPPSTPAVDGNGKPPASSVAPDPARSPAYDQGAIDWRALQGLFAGLKGDRHAGADWWAAHRGYNPVPCNQAAEDYSDDRQVASLFEAGCADAKRWLDRMDVKRNADPQYKAGFNDAAKLNSGL